MFSEEAVSSGPGVLYADEENSALLNYLFMIGYSRHISRKKVKKNEGNDEILLDTRFAQEGIIGFKTELLEMFSGRFTVELVGCDESFCNDKIAVDMCLKAAEVQNSYEFKISGNFRRSII